MHPYTSPRRVVGGTLAAGLVAGVLGLTAAQADAAPAIGLKGHTLLVKGTAGNDRLALRLHAGAPDKIDVDVGDNGSADLVVSRNKVDRIRVKGGRGNDQIRIDDANGAFTTTIPTRIDGQGGNDAIRGGAGAERLNGDGGSDTIDGNGGNDVADLGAGDDRFIWDPGDGSDTVEGRKGADTMTFNGSGANETFRVTANGRRTRLTRDVGNITMDFDGIETVDVNSLGGNDVVNVDDLAATKVRTVDHDEAAALGGTAPDAGTDRTIVGATNANDAVTAAGAAGTAAVTGLAATVNVAHAEAARDALTINALGGDDRVDASTLGADTMKLTEDGGAGDDTLLGGRGNDVQLGGDNNDALDGNQGNDTALMGAGDDRFTWDPGDGSDTIEGQAGSDLLAFNGANVAETFDVSANGGRVRFVRNIANITMDLNGVERIDVNALGGADQLTVNDVSGTGLTAVNSDLAATIGGTTGDGAQDQVIVKATNGADVIAAGGAAGSASVTGLSAAIGIAHAEAAQDTLTVDALGGDDVVEAPGLAADAIRLEANGGDGDDVLIGGAGPDTLRGDANDDVLLGGPGVDVLDGGPGSNVVIQD
ncbi:MAG TPA: calcium-binding protein [Solirubrobacteraceae bacterium]